MVQIQYVHSQTIALNVYTIQVRANGQTYETMKKMIRIDRLIATDWRFTLENQFTHLENCVNRFNFKAIAIGTAAMMILDILVSVILFLLYSTSTLAPGPSQAALTEAKLSLAHNSSYLMVGLLLGTLTTVLGGYLSARIAKTLPLYNGLAVGVLGLFAGIFLGGGIEESPWWYLTVGYLSVIPAALVGAWFSQQKSTE